LINILQAIYGKISLKNISGVLCSDLMECKTSTEYNSEVLETLRYLEDRQTKGTDRS
jgi:hypothetical protein